MIQQYTRALLCGGVFVVTSAILKFTWYDNLEPENRVLTAGTATDTALDPAAST